MTADPDNAARAGGIPRSAEDSRLRHRLLVPAALLVGGFVLQFAGLWLGAWLDDGKAPAEPTVWQYFAPAIAQFWPEGFHSNHFLSGLLLGLGGDALLYALVLFLSIRLARWLLK